MTTWTEERTEALRRLWNENLPASAIADTLGGGLTRNAVIAKAHRLGLSGRRKAAPRGSRRPRNRPASPHPVAAPASADRPDGGEPATDPVDGEPQSAPPSASPEIIGGISLLELSNRTCRWPLGAPHAPATLFCGERPAGGQPYCRNHCRVAYQPSRPRKRPAGAATIDAEQAARGHHGVRP